MVILVDIPLYAYRWLRRTSGKRRRLVEEEKERKAKEEMPTLMGFGSQCLILDMRQTAAFFLCQFPSRIQSFMLCYVLLPSVQFSPASSSLNVAMASADIFAAPSSTLALFRDILRNAESEAFSDDSGQGRAKLFHIATKLAKLNLLDEDASSAGSSNAIWEIILNFLTRYPDYALYRPVSEHENKVGNLQNCTEDQEDGQELQEEMGVWLLPRLLRRLATLVSASGPLSASKSKELRVRYETWISRTLQSLPAQFYRKEENGVLKHRIIVIELLTLLRGVRISS